MCDGYPLLVVAPVLGLAVYCLAHVLLCRMDLRRGRYFPLTAGFCLGLLATSSLVAIGLFAMKPSALDCAGQTALTMSTYLALAFGYFNFVNMNMTALRIRILQELLEAGGSLSKEQLLASYNTEEVIEVRIDRLVHAGHLVQRDGRYFSGKFRFLLVSRIFDLLRWISAASRR